MRKVIRRRSNLPLAAGALLLGGCASISYKPSLSLGPSPVTIHRKVQVETFRDESPPGDKGKKVAGTSATEPGTLAGDLSGEVTNAVITDFNINAVFEVVRARVDDPDLIMRGTIRRFYGHAGPNALFWSTIPVDFIWLFGLPIQSDHGEVDLAVQFYRRDGTLVSSYTGHSKFSAMYTMYTNPLLGIGTRLNKSFDDAISQIRRQIVSDAERLGSMNQGR